MESDITFHIGKQEAELALKVNSAAHYGDLYQLKGLIRAGADPNKTDYDGRSPLVRIDMFIELCHLSMSYHFICVVNMFILLGFGYTICYTLKIYIYQFSETYIIWVICRIQITNYSFVFAILGFGIIRLVFCWQCDFQF